MRGVVKIAVVLVSTLLVGGLVVTSIGKARNAAQLAQCQNNLKSLGMAVVHHHDAMGYYPTGTLPNPNLEPDKRLGWLVQVWPAYMVGGVTTRFDEKKSWDAKENCPPRWFVRQYTEDLKPWYEERVMGDVKWLTCCAHTPRTDLALPARTDYVGLAGIGEAAAELPLSDPKTGFFGYDRKLTLRNIKDGTATTIAVAEAMDGGPWTAGGQATVRGLVAGDVPYLGEQGQLGANHPGGTNVLFADGSVRPLTESVSPQVFEALATIAGKEEVGSFDE